MTLLDANTFTGATVVLGGTLTLANSNANTGTTTVSGAAVNAAFTAGVLVLNTFGTTATSAVTIDQGGTVTLDNTAVNTPGRFTNTTKPNLIFNSGSFNFLANNGPGAASSETLGTVTLASGQSVISAGYAVAPATGVTSSVTSANLVRNVAGATVNFIGGTGNVTPLGTATNQLIFTQINGGAPSAAIVGSSTVAGHIGDGILPWAEVNGGSGTGDFATYNGSGGTGINAFQGYAASIATATATDTVKETAAETVAASKTINALLINAATAALQVTVNAGVVLTLSSGAFMANGTGGQIQIGNAFVTGSPQGTLNFGTAEGILFSNASVSNTNIDTFITGSGGVTLNGANITTWNTGVSTYTGGTTLNSGTVITQGATPGTAFGTGAITLTGGTLSVNTANATINNPISLNGLITVTTNAVIFNGPVTLTNNVVLSPAVNVTFNGSIGESGGARSLIVAERRRLSDSEQRQHLQRRHDPGRRHPHHRQQQRARQRSLDLRGRHS